MISLSVNLNKIALIRNARGGNVPDLSQMAAIVMNAGAHGITLHPRPDGRHARPADVFAIGDLLATGEYGRGEFNLEGNPFSQPGDDYPGYMSLARQAKVDQCTLVPDAPDQMTSDAGWELSGHQGALVDVIAELKSLGRRISLFIAPEPRWVEAAAGLGADRVELFTGPWAAAYRKVWAGVSDGLHEEAEKVLAGYRETAERALACGLGINAGHDLQLDNLRGIANLPGLLEVSIGHALTHDALQVGLPQAVKNYLEVLDSESIQQSELELGS